MTRTSGAGTNTENRKEGWSGEQLSIKSKGNPLGSRLDGTFAEERREHWLRTTRLSVRHLGQRDKVMKRRASVLNTAH